MTNEECNSINNNKERGMYHSSLLSMEDIDCLAFNKAIMYNKIYICLLKGVEHG